MGFVDDGTGISKVRARACEHACERKILGRIQGGPGVGAGAGADSRRAQGGSGADGRPGIGKVRTHVQLQGGFAADRGWIRCGSRADPGGAHLPGVPAAMRSACPGPPSRRVVPPGSGWPQGHSRRLARPMTAAHALAWSPCHPRATPHCPHRACCSPGECGQMRA